MKVISDNKLTFLRVFRTCSKSLILLNPKVHATTSEFLQGVHLVNKILEYYNINPETNKPIVPSIPLNCSATLRKKRKRDIFLYDSQFFPFLAAQILSHHCLER